MEGRSVLMYEIVSGVVQTAQKVVIYGPEGIGKSTFASMFPDPLFIDTEGSTKKLNVKRYPKPTSWEMLRNLVIQAMKTKPCETLIIDTIDWAEQLCINAICSQHQKKGIEDFGYGNGYVYEKEEFGKFLNLLQDVVDSGINVVLTAHAQMRKFEQPDEMGAYDRWELKLGKKTSSQISPLVKEWADMVFFANYKTYAVAVDDKGKKFKAQGGERIMYTTHHPCWDAKNRDGLPPEMPFSYESIAHLFAYTGVQAEIQPQQTVPVQSSVTVPQQADAFEMLDESIPTTTQKPADMQGIPKALADLMIANNVDESDIRLAVSQRGYYPQNTPIANYEPSFVEGCLIGAWEQLLPIIRSNQDLPFE